VVLVICDVFGRRKRGAEKGVAGHGHMMRWNVSANTSTRQRPTEPALSGMAADKAGGASW
jgi:hypothetical protein